MGDAFLKREEYQRRYQQFLARLRQARKDAGLRQEDVRQRINTYQSFMSKIESGERRVDIVELQELAVLYGKADKRFKVGRPSMSAPDTVA